MKQTNKVSITGDIKDKSLKPVSGDKPDSSKFEKEDKRSSRNKPWKGNKDRKRNVDYTDVPLHNDIEWYRKAEKYTDTAVQFNFNIPFGSELPTITDGPSGITRHLYAPLLGQGNGTTKVFDNGSEPLDLMSETEFYAYVASSPFYIAAVNMYSFVRYSNSGARNYYIPDMAMMLASAMSIYSIFPLLWKVLSVSKHFEFSNRYIGQALVNAMGFNFKDIITNYNSYVTQINALAIQCNTIRVPKGLSILERWSWLNGNIFTDNNLDKNIKQQYHIMYPMYLWEYDEYTNGGYLKAIDLRPPHYASNSQGYSAIQSLQDIINILQHAISCIRSSESFGIMMGDILKAYKESGLYSVPTITDNISFAPLYSPEFVVQIQNRESLFNKFFNGEADSWILYNGASGSTAINNPGWGSWLELGDSFNVYQDTRQEASNNGVLWQGKRSVQGGKMYPGLPIHMKFSDTKYIPFLQEFFNKHALNLYTDEPTSDVLIYATRFMFNSAIYRSIQPYMATRCIMSSGTEVIVESAVILLSKESSVTGTDKSVILAKGLYDISLSWASGLGSSHKEIANMLFNASQWVTSPRLKLQIYASLDTFELGSDYNTFGDVINPAFLTNADLAKINAPCLYSEWVVPGSDGIRGTLTESR